MRRKNDFAARSWYRKSCLETLEQRTLLDATPIVTEVMNVASPPTDDELLLAPGTVAVDYNYLELWNPSDVDEIDLSGWQLSGSASFSFPDQTLAPHSFAVVAADVSAFEARYGDAITVLGSFESGELSEKIVDVAIADADENPVIAFQIGGHPLWPTGNQLPGLPLEPVSPDTVSPDRLSRPMSWTVGPMVSGTPGVAAVASKGVAINEVLATIEGGIELVNTSESPVDVSGWFLSDADDNLLKYEFPAESVIAAGGFLVVSDADVNPDPEDPQPEYFSLVSSDPGRLWLSRDGGGFVEDVAEYDAMPAGVAAGRVGNDQPLLPLETPTLGSENGKFRIGPMVFNEVHFHPGAPTPGDLELAPSLVADDLEFIELFNPSGEQIDLSGWELAGDIDVTFADGTFVGSNEAVLVTAFDSTASENDGLLAAFENHFAGISESYRIVGHFGEQLRDDYGRIDLLRSVEKQVGEGEDPAYELFLEDTVAYDGSDFPLADGGGASINRSSFGLLGVDAAGWKSAVPSPGYMPASGVWLNEISVTQDGGGIELFNSSDAPVGIGGWQVSDDRGQPAKYSIAPETTIDAGGYFVISESDLNPDPDNSPGAFSLVNAGPGEIVLSRGDAGYLFEEDHAEYFAMQNGESFGRTAADQPFAPNSTSSLGEPNSEIRVGPVVVSEVHFSPLAPTEADLLIAPELVREDLEFVEIFNDSDGNVDLAGWKIVGDLDLSFGEATVVAPNEAVFVTTFDFDAPENSSLVEAFENHHGLEASSYRVVGHVAQSLPDDIGRVTLLRAESQPVQEGEEPDFIYYLEDDVTYDVAEREDANGTGRSIERVASTVLGTSSSSWQTSTATPSFTPLVPEFLPDLVLWRDELVGVNYPEYFEPHETTNRMLMRFGTGVVNVGSGPLIVEGSGVVEDAQTVVQVIDREDGSQIERSAGEFVLHPGHGHIHFDGYALYNLRVVLPDGGVGPLVATSDKVSFCLLDFALFDPDIPGTPEIPQYLDCEVSTQGISVGWADVYPADLPDQWIDIEDVPPGEYWFETVIDPFDLIKESNEDNNSMQTRVTIGAAEYEPDQFDVVDGPRTSLGVGDHSFDSLSIHEPGDVDSFTWIAASDGTVNIDLEFDAELGDIDLYVSVGSDIVGDMTVDENGQYATLDVTEGVTYRIIVKSLEAQTHPEYSLTIDGPDIDPDFLEENDTLDTATFLGTGDKHLSDLTIHEPGGTDFFAWTATDTGMLHIDVQFSAAEGLLELTAFDIQRREDTEGLANVSPLIMEFDVVAGHTYLFKVNAAEGDYSTNYELTLDYLEVEADPFEPNDHNFTPVDIGVGSMELNDLTIHTPFNRDFFQWRPAAAGSLDVSIVFDHEASDLDLIIWEDGESVRFLRSETDDESASFDVHPDTTYMFEVVGKTGSTSPRYNLILDAPETPVVESIDVSGSGWQRDTAKLLFGEDDVREVPIAPWDGVDKIQVTFSKDVSLTESDWELLDADASVIDSVAYSYDAEVRVGTWSLPQALTNGNVTLRILDSVVDSDLNTLDGEQGHSSQFPTGDGEPGGHFEFTFEVLIGDVTADGIVDVDDLDAVSALVRDDDLSGDIDGNGIAESEDRQRLLGILQVRPGDADLSGMFTSTDLIIVFQANEYEDDQELNSTWAEGDWNGDGEFGSGDLIVAFQAGYDELAPAARPASRAGVSAALQFSDEAIVVSVRPAASNEQRPGDNKQPKPVDLTLDSNAINWSDVAAARYSLVDQAVTDMHESDDDAISDAFLP